VAFGDGVEEDDVAQGNVLPGDHDWVRLNPQSQFWLDVAVFEDAFAAAHGVPGKHSSGCAVLLKRAVESYKGDLLAVATMTGASRA